MQKNILFILALCLISGLIPQPAEAVEFNLVAGAHYHYKIIIHQTQANNFTSTDNFNSDSGQLAVETDYILYESIEVLENMDNEYARIVCRYDSLEGTITSGTGSEATTIILKALRDSLEIRQADSLIAVYSPGSYSDQTALEYYDRLLFIGEPIEMLVYPSGEIISVSENENLWEQAGDLIGFYGNGFLQVQLQENSPGASNWQQSIAIAKLGNIKLKNRINPLEMAYSVVPSKSKIDFSGILTLRDYISPATIASLSDEFQVSIGELKLSKSGSLEYCGQKIIIKKMDYNVSLAGDILLSGENGRNFQTALKLISNSRIEYELLDDCPDQ